jgi:Domain of unknown function (DUF6895)
MVPTFGPERLPSEVLEIEWLERVWPCSTPGRRSRALSASMLNRSLDVLAGSRLDMYALTHAAMFASDFGARRGRLPRRVSAIRTDAGLQPGSG